ncbi:MAG: 5-(carboxyamino)imidazole ribonucleotide mutase [Candidatus Zixiibacteriota bacterium]
MKKVEKKKAEVLILIGSKSDQEVMSHTEKILKDFGIPFEKVISSAHRNPERTKKIIQASTKKGMKIIIAGAGMSAALPGFVASHTNLPVIGVPLNSSPLSGLDSLLSMMQMPPGVPVATVAIGKAGAKNAGILAAQILSLTDKRLKRKLTQFKKTLKK